MRIVAVVNQKGGVGKTTTALNVAHALTMTGRRVLLLDIDPQANLGSALGLGDRQSGMDDVLLDAVALTARSIEARQRLHVVTAGARLASVERTAAAVPGSGRRLGGALAGVEDMDFCVIDCPPSVSVLTVNALHAAHELLIPVSADYLGMVGLSNLARSLLSMENALQVRLQKRVALTRYHADRTLGEQVWGQVRWRFPGQVLPTRIRETPTLAESPCFGKTIFEHDYAGPGSADYRALAEDLLEGRMI